MILRGSRGWKNNLRALYKIDYKASKASMHRITAIAVLTLAFLASGPNHACNAQNGVTSSTGDGGLHFKSVEPVEQPQQALDELKELISKIRLTVTDAVDKGLLPRVAAGQLQTALGKARNSAIEICAAMLDLLLDGSVIEILSHKAVSVTAY